eukprot:TRINITY_DN7239_c0_g1_i1.p1 TRINITY_DN7239_c0_g1~~TRINITY_DN7239_c0_g1_i1.p1  ORF type:complete len:118 (-),score=16.17 TRINITY_DN7239_c0_g1_i1:5-328(-)
MLSGVLSDLVCSLKSLLNLTVSFNFFSGFSQDCTRLFYRNVGFDFSANCIPGGNMQRPPTECNWIPGGLNCIRIPSTRPVMCNPEDQIQDVNPTHYMLEPSIPSTPP